MKALVLLLFSSGLLVAQQPTEPVQPSAADITRGRTGGDASRTSTSVRVEGDANQGAGVNTLSGATSEGTIPIDRSAAEGRTPSSPTTPLSSGTGAVVTPTPSPTPTPGTSPSASENPTPSPSPAAASEGAASGPNGTGPGAER